MCEVQVAGIGYARGCGQSPQPHHHPVPPATASGRWGGPAGDTVAGATSMPAPAAAAASRAARGVRGARTGKLWDVAAAVSVAAAATSSGSRIGSTAAAGGDTCPRRASLDGRALHSALAPLGGGVGWCVSSAVVWCCVWGGATTVAGPNRHAPVAAGHRPQPQPARPCNQTHTRTPVAARGPYVGATPGPAAPASSAPCTAAGTAAAAAVVTSPSAPPMDTARAGSSRRRHASGRLSGHSRSHSARRRCSRGAPPTRSNHVCRRHRRRRLRVMCRQQAPRRPPRWRRGRTHGRRRCRASGGHRASR